jgi:hypothetical protein
MLGWLLLVLRRAWQDLVYLLRLIHVPQMVSDEPMPSITTPAASALLASDDDSERHSPVNATHRNGARNDVLLLSYVWNDEDEKERSTANIMFHRYRQQGYAIHRIDEAGVKGEQITTFDAHIGRMGVFHPMNQWDHIREAPIDE